MRGNKTVWACGDSYTTEPGTYVSWQGATSPRPREHSPIAVLEPWDSQRRFRRAARLLSGDPGWLQVSGGDPNLERVLIQLTTLQGRFGDSGEEPVRCCEALVLAEGWRWEWLGRDGGSSWKGYPREINQTLLQGKVHPQTERTHKWTPWKRVTKPMSWA